ncbi:HPr kinase/phosphorylase [Aurantimonas sp. MSK8Z-1]|uniref:HPr kinase/phosphorylase n=1 Tax=Mangrovibrevibacter kandeliae TaxID=2968473 RepID=UPI002117B8D0|nr:HPr kinase/phosphorylase [Aurantimonas sp. MSK8Z-1]MCW4115138.1 HPr kinase/phosphorylase [Aurantimonas sp. MSK8Z-1]
MSSFVNVHATAIRLGGFGILIRGPARSGKSALALAALRRAEAAGLTAALVSDDQVFVEAEGDALLARAPETIRGLIEVSGVGILRQPTVGGARIELLADLVPTETIDRLPDQTHVHVCGIMLRRILLPAREAAFAADVLVTLTQEFCATARATR